jgi:hypothetical protein
MSRRIAHRPRYHFTRPTPHFSPRSHHDYLRTRWMYRRQPGLFQRRTPGQSLLHVPRMPWGYRLFRGAMPLSF